MIKNIFLFLVLNTAAMQLFGMDPNHALGPRRQQPGAAAQERTEQVKQLWLACKAGDEVRATELLQGGVNPNTRLFADPNILPVAAPNDQEGEAGEAVLDEVGYDNSTCLHYAANAGHLGVVDLLFRYGASTNPRDQNGWIPLISALVGGHETVVDRLIARGAQVHSIDAFLGHRPIATPVQCLNPRLVQRLLKAGAAVLPPLEILHNNMPLQRIYQGGVLHILCERLQRRPAHAPEYGAQETEDRALEIIEMVRAHGIDMGHQDTADNTVFHAAAHLNDKRIMAALMVSSNYTQAIRQAARAQLKTVLLANQREDTGLPVLPREVVLRIFSHMPIECKQACNVDLDKLIVPHYVDVTAMRTRYLDACLVDLKKHSWHSIPEVQSLLTVLGAINKGQQQACDLTTDPLLQKVLNPIYWN